MTFLKFMSSGAGRITRIAAGAVLVGVGIALGGGWLIVSVVGAVPFLAGVFDVCLFAPLGRMPFVGKKFRQQVAGR